MAYLDSVWVDRGTNSTMLSVIIPCFNDGLFLGDAITSVVGQQEGTDVRLPDMEIVIVDDNSNDADTLTLLTQLPDRWPKLRVVKNVNAKGVSGARNTGIEASRGEWIAFLDADDVWPPDSLAHRWRVVQETPGAAWVAGDFLLWHSNGTLLPRTVEPNHISEIVSQAYLTGKPLTLKRPVKEFVRACLVLPSGVMLRRSLIDIAGGFNESMPAAEDYELWLRLASVADLYFVPQNVFHYRQRDRSLSHREGPSTQLEIEFFRRLLVEGAFREFSGEIRRKLAEMYLANVYYFRRRHQRHSAVLSAARMVRWQPLSPNGWKQLIASAIGL